MFQGSAQPQLVFRLRVVGEFFRDIFLRVCVKRRLKDKNTSLVFGVERFGRRAPFSHQVALRGYAGQLVTALVAMFSSSSQKYVM